MNTDSKQWHSYILRTWWVIVQGRLDNAEMRLPIWDDSIVITHLHRTLRCYKSTSASRLCHERDHLRSSGISSQLHRHTLLEHPRMLLQVRLRRRWGCARSIGFKRNFVSWKFGIQGVSIRNLPVMYHSTQIFWIFPWRMNRSSARGCLFLIAKVSQVDEVPFS